MKNFRIFQIVTKIIALAILLAYAIAFFGTYDMLQAVAMTALAALVVADFVIMGRQIAKKN